MHTFSIIADIFDNCANFDNRNFGHVRLVVKGMVKVSVLFFFSLFFPIFFIFDKKDEQSLFNYKENKSVSGKSCIIYPLQKWHQLGNLGGVIEYEWVHRIIKILFNLLFWLDIEDHIKIRMIWNYWSERSYQNTYDMKLLKSTYVKI